VQCLKQNSSEAITCFHITFVSPSALTLQYAARMSSLLSEVQTLLRDSYDDTWYYWSSRNSTN